MVTDLIGKGQQGLYCGELWPEAILFIEIAEHARQTNPIRGAGGTTTASAMSAMLSHLAQNPDTYMALAKEIRPSFQSPDEIRFGPQLASCKYLRACIEETLRMAPPSLTIPWHEQEAGQDEPFIVDGHVIPPGTQVGVSLYSLLHNPEYFSDPYTFSPERWLSGGNNEDLEQEDHIYTGPRIDSNKAEEPKPGSCPSDMRRAFTPSLIGDRVCAGRAMAYIEMSSTLARTLWLFDFEFAPGVAGDLGGMALYRVRLVEQMDVVVRTSIG